MPDKKITELAVATAPTGAELIEIVQGGVNKQTTLQDVADLAAGGVTSVNSQTGVVVLDAADVGADPAGSASTAQSAAIAAAAAATIGVQDLPIPAQAMWPRVTSGCSVLTQYEMATSLLNLQGLEFSSTVQQFAQMEVPLPRKYTSGVITAVVHWKPLASGSGDVRWGIQLASYRNDDALTTAFGTEVAVTDTFIATDDLHITTVSGTITPSGTLAAGNLMALQINRDPTNGSDTLDVNAVLLSVVVRFTMAAAIDA